MLKSFLQGMTTRRPQAAKAYPMEVLLEMKTRTRRMMMMRMLMLMCVKVPRKTSTMLSLSKHISPPVQAD